MILALRSGHTPLPQLTATLRRWEGSGIQLFGFVMGDDRPQACRVPARELDVGVTA
jgi:hypothetical protein